MRIPFFAGMIASAIGVTSVSADTLILKDGQAIQGRYLSGDTRNLQFEVNGKPFTYSISFVRELRISDNGAPSTPPPSQLTAGWSGPRGKQQQAAFCQVIQDFRNEQLLPNKESNPIKRAKIRPPDPWSFESRIAAVFGPNGEFADWTGFVYFDVANNVVSVHATVDCPPGLPTVNFANGYSLDKRKAAQAAQISLGSTLSEQLGNIQPGSKCRISGRLFLRSADSFSGAPSTQNGPDPRQRFEGPNPSDVVNVTNTQHLVQFSQIQQIQK